MVSVIRTRTVCKVVNHLIKYLIVRKGLVLIAAVTKCANQEILRALLVASVYLTNYTPRDSLAHPRKYTTSPSEVLVNDSDDGITINKVQFIQRL